MAPLAQILRQRARVARYHKLKKEGSVQVASQAAIVPQTERVSGAARQTVEHLSDVGTKTTHPFDRDAFKERLHKATGQEMIARAETKEEAERVMDQGAANASAALGPGLQGQRDKAAGGLPAAAKPENEASPDQQHVPDTVVVLQPEAAGPALSPVDAAPAVPPPLTGQQLDYSADRAATDQMMAESQVTTEQMQEGNDPAFGPALSARVTAEQHEAEAPGNYRADEARIRTDVATRAHAAVRAGLSGMHGVREGRLGNVAGQQLDLRKNDSLKRAQIMALLTQIKSDTQADVNRILDEMDREASLMFTVALKEASERYEKRFSDVKGGVLSRIRHLGYWDEHIAQALVEARGAYNQRVNVAIDQVADYVDRQIKAAKDRAAFGERRSREVVGSLGGEMDGFAAQAEAAIGTDFGAMQSQIDQRCEALTNRLSEQLKTSYDKMKDREEELREENKSLWDRVYDATVGAVKKIIEFKNLLFSVLAKAASVVLDIVAHPIRFLGNLVDAVGQGLRNFKANIGKHLKKGLMEWIFGSLAGAGLKLPDEFDLEGIISIALQIFGLTYDNFRARAVNLLGEPIVGNLEKSADVFMVFMREGAAGIWRFIKEQVAELKSLVLDAIWGYIKEEVIMAGIEWIIGLLNPASAFFKACKAIYEIIVFIVNRGAQIIAFVNAVIDSIADIVAGNLGAAIAAVENALARAIPLAIGFLASLLGLGDPSKPVKATLEKARSPVNRAIDWVIHGAVKLVKAAGKLLTGSFAKKDHGKEERPAHEHDPAKAAKIEAGLAALDAEDVALAKEGATQEQADAIAAKVARAHPVFKSIKAVAGEDTWDYEYVASPPYKRRGARMKPLPERMYPPSKPAAFDMSNLKSGKKGAARRAIHKEFVSQVQMQEEALREMTVAGWERNRRAFVRRQKRTGSGRHPDSAEGQRQFRSVDRAWWEAIRAEEIAKSRGHRTPTAADLEAAERAFEKESPQRRQAATHRLDMVAGGDYDEFEMGGSAVNSSIGPQWTASTRIDRLHADVDKFKAKIAKQRGRKELTKAQLGKILMNVKLTWTG